MRFKLEEVGGPIEWDEIAALEDTLGHRIPDELREFIKSNNGGRMPPNLIDVDSFPRPEEFKVRLNWFLRVRDSNARSTLQWTWELWCEYNHPSHLLPFATDIVGSKFCISLDGGDRGSIYYHDNSGDGTDPTCRYSDCYRVASGFTEFLEMIQPSMSWR